MRFPTRRLPTPFRTARPLLGALSALLLAAAVPAGADPQLVLRSGDARIVQLRAGDSLSAELDGRQPFASYRFVLSDDKGTPIAHHTTKADGAGRAAVRPLWTNSGVVGCDPGAAPDVKLYRFKSYREAEAALPGRLLEVTVFEASGAVAARRPLKVIATGEERAFFSDADACPRFSFRPEEPVFLSFLHLEPGAAERRFFLVAESPENLPLGAALQEIRDATFPQLLDLAGAAPNVTFEVWTPGAHDLGGFTGVVRRLPSSFPYLLGGDTLLGVGDERSSAGLSITVDSTGCPPGPG